ncbi:hypothetical protein JW935_23570 [candidate division KSB1 bacterium]|nr:hypothetical protein [candidate division KSB1 bacterium]
MKRYLIFCIFQTMLLIFTSLAFSSPLGHGAGPVNVSPAWTITKGSLFVRTWSRLYLKDQVITRNGVSSAEMHSNVQAGLGCFYGFTPHLELGLAQIFYQDTNKPPKANNFPDDLFFRLKLGSLGLKKSAIRFGVQFDLRLPTAQVHNIPLESYSSSRMSYGFSGLFSIVSNTFQPDSGVTITANIGTYNHWDLGTKLTTFDHDSLMVRANSRELVYGVSFVNVVNKFSYFAEVYGRAFLQRPPPTAYTRETTVYFSPGVSYQTNEWLRFRCSLDLLILGIKDLSKYSDDPKEPTALVRAWHNAPNMSTWRITMGARITLKRGKIDKRVKRDKARATYRLNGHDEDLYVEIAQEKRKAESAEYELDRIRAERKRMEDLIERLQTMLNNPSDTGSSSQEGKKKPE